MKDMADRQPSSFRIPSQLGRKPPDPVVCHLFSPAYVNVTFV